MKILMKDIMLTWQYMTREQYNKTSEKAKQDLFENRLQELRAYYKVPKRSSDYTPTMSEISVAHRVVMDNFTYVPDDKQYGKPDFWDTEGLRKLLLIGHIWDDCDGAGMPMAEFLHRVFGVSRSALYRASCSTETNEPHYVCWVTCRDGITYQIENRVRRVRSIRYMRDMGYEYWHYQRMTNLDDWYPAPAKASEFIYQTPANLEADEAEFTISKATAIGKSKTIVKEWVGVVSGVGATVVGVLQHNAVEVVNTLQANQHNLAQFVTPTKLGILMVVLSLLGIYLRTVTHKDIEMKRGYDG